MSLDETFDALTAFAGALAQFDERLRAGRAVIREKHAAIDGIWTDALRRQYDAAIEELDRQLTQYAESRSEQFERHLAVKISQLRSYLHGE